MTEQQYIISTHALWETTEHQVPNGMNDNKNLIAETYKYLEQTCTKK